jgi:hypothetical protein
MSQPANRSAAPDRPCIVEVLYFDGCPNHDALLPHLRALLAAHNIAADLTTTPVHSDEDAHRLRFLGSPTVRVNGTDVDPGSATRTDYGMQCRLYNTPAGLTGTPPDNWILDAISRQ